MSRPYAIPLPSLPANSAGVFVRLDYCRALGDHVAGVLLSQIHFWYRPDAKKNPKLYRQVDGSWWIVKTLEQWGEECGMLTPMQVRRGFDLLRAVGLIETRTFLYGRSMVTHVRATGLGGRRVFAEESDLLILPGDKDRIRAKADAYKAPESQKTYASRPYSNKKEASPADPFLSPTCYHNNESTPDTCYHNNSFINKEIKEKKKRHKPCTAPFGLCETQPSEKDCKDSKEDEGTHCLTPTSAKEEPDMATKAATKGSVSKTSHQVLQELKDKNQLSAHKVKGGKVTTKKIQDLWMALVPKHHTSVGFMKPLTAKQRGQLYHYLKKTEGYAEEGLVWAVENWSRFRIRVSDGYNKTVGSIPDTGALLMYADVAVNGFLSDKKLEEQTAALAAAQLIAPAPVLSIQPKKKGKKATLEELEQLGKLFE